MNRKYGGLKFIAVFLEVIILSVLCAWIIVNYYPKEAGMGLLISAFVAVPAAMLITLALLFQVSPKDVWDFIRTNDEEYQKLIPVSDD